MAVAVVEFGEHQVGAVELVAGGAEVRAEGAGVGAAGDAVVQQPGSLRTVFVGGGSGVGAQVVVQVAGDGAGLGEGGQGAGERGRLGAGGDPDGQAAGGDVVDGGAAGVGGEQAVVDEVLVQGQVGEQAVLGQWPGEVGCAAGFVGRGGLVGAQPGRGPVPRPGVGILGGQSPASRSRLSSSRPD